MGRGKKKGDKQKKKEEEEPSISTLSISDPQPSTAGSVQPSVEENVGVPPSEAGLPQLPTSAPNPVEEEEGGLGLTGARKRGPRKKKGPKTDAAPMKTESAPSVETTPPVTATAVPLQSVQPLQPVRQATPRSGRGRTPPPFSSHVQGPSLSHTQAPPGFQTPQPSQTSQQWPQPAAQQRPMLSVSGPFQARAPSFPTSQPAQTPQAWSQPAAQQRSVPSVSGPSQARGPPGFPTSQPAQTPQAWAQPAAQQRPVPTVSGPSEARGPPSFPTSQPAQTPQAWSQQTAQQRPSVQQPIVTSDYPPQQIASKRLPAGAPAAQATPKATSTHLQRKTPEQSSQICLFKIPNKIPGGKVPAIQIKVLANYLQMKIKPLKIARYDVSFKPDKPKKMIPKAFTLAKEKCFPKHIIAFDQMKNCYSLKPLPGVTATDRFATNVEIIDNNGRKLDFEVSFKATGNVDLGTILSYMENGTSLSPPTEAIQCVDVVLRQGTLESYIKAGRQFFKRPARPIELGDGLEMWTGLFQSAIFTSRPFVNIDVAHKGFPKHQPLMQAIVNDFRLDTGRPILQQRGRGVENFKDFIKGLRVIATVGGDKSSSAQKREFICNGLVDPPNRLKFTMTDQSGKQVQMTVLDYFIKEKKCRLQYPNMDCMWVGPREKNIYYPIELLEVAYGQARNKQLNEMQLSTMVREAATPPDDRKRKIEEVIKDMKYSNNPYFREFGLEIGNEFIEVEAKILKPPNLEVGNRQSVMPRRGVWQSNQVYKPEALRTWGFIAIETDPRNCDYEKIKSLIMSVGRSMGMEVAEPMMTHFNVNMRDLDKILFTAIEKGVNFLFIIVSTRGRDYYHRVKQKAEREVGILTQCIKEMTASRRMNPQTARNILLKVNSKLMGINQVLDGRSLPNCLRSGGVMVVGADVTHPSPDQSSVPSIAAVTASIDPKCFQYNITLSIQTPKKEMIVEFEDMMVEHLHVYRKHNGNTLPKKIFVFRDGVSEGQFGQVMNSELQAVHRAYQIHKGTNEKPEVLFLLVQKRHHTRFFLGAQNSQNVEPGTVVDKHIVHARELDFYLVSHAAIKGTARPTRYHAVCNDGAIPDDEVEQLTYYLCHLYSRCMRAVSYPTPTYYAHLACLRARSLTYGETFDNRELERSPKRLRVLDKMLNFSRMFFV